MIALKWFKRKKRVFPQDESIAVSEPVYTKHINERFKKMGNIQVHSDGKKTFYVIDDSKEQPVTTKINIEDKLFSLQDVFRSVNFWTMESIDPVDVLKHLHSNA